MSDFPQDCIPSCEAEIGGYVWRIFADTKPETIEKILLVTKALNKRGFSAPKRMAFGGAKPHAKPLTQPLYDQDGTPCCPFHTQRSGKPTPIRFVGPKDGRPGFWGCPSQQQGVPGETINPRGYCDLRFDVPAAEAPQNGAHAGKVTR